MAMIRALRLRHSLPSARFRYLQLVRQSFSGFNEDANPDYWYPTILGTLELLVYPFLIAGAAGSAIGAWLALKTVAQWTRWQSDRTTFNLFLVGNLLALIVAFGLARFVSPR
jgi:hypothetical protein